MRAYSLTDVKRAIHYSGAKISDHPSVILNDVAVVPPPNRTLADVESLSHLAEENVPPNVASGIRELVPW
jgi:hypothetical protein